MIDLVKEIAQADEIEIESLLKAVMERYNVLFPDWDLNVYTLRKSGDQNEQLDRMIEVLQGLKTNAAD